MHCSRDSKLLKNAIWFLWILDTVHLTFITHTLYTYCVSNFGNAAALTRSIWSVSGQAYITCVSEFMVRTIFTHRVWRLSNSNVRVPLIMVISLLSLAHLVGGFVASIEMDLLGTMLLPPRVNATMNVALMSGVAVDALIAASIVISLLKSRTGFKKTDGIVTTLTLYAVSTCLLTCMWGFITCIVHIVFPSNAIYLGMFFLISEFSLNALLATLNAREKLRDRTYGVTSVPVEFGTITRTTGQTGSGGTSEPIYEGSMPSKMIIDVEHHVEIRGDPKPNS